jgi:hypothetical protein
LAGGIAKCQYPLIQYPPTRKEAKMTVNGYTYKVGDLFTTLKSKKTGVIKEIIPNASGSVRVLLELPTKETRWTTVSDASLV